MRDPNTVDLKFMEGQPIELVDKMSKEEWDSLIKEINGVIIDKISILRIFLFFFGHTDVRNLEIDLVVERANCKFKERGIHFCNPRSLQFQEMEIIIKL